MNIAQRLLARFLRPAVESIVRETMAEMSESISAKVKAEITEVANRGGSFSRSIGRR